MVFLVLIGLTFWAINKTIGFQLLFLLSFSVIIAHIIRLFLPVVYIGDNLVPLTHPPIQAVMTFFAFFIPLARSRLELIATLAPIFAFSLTFLLFTNTPVFSIVSAIVIGGFIVYGFYRSFDWIESMPDRYLMLFSIVLPIFLAAIIYPNTSYLLHAGYLLGAGTGVSCEFIKVRMNIPSSLSRRLIAALIGLSGIALLKVFAPLPLFGNGIAIGLWITLIVPLLLVMFNIYSQEGKGTLIDSN